MLGIQESNEFECHVFPFAKQRTQLMKIALTMRFAQGFLNCGTLSLHNHEIQELLPRETIKIALKQCESAFSVIQNGVTNYFYMPYCAAAPVFESSSWMHNLP